jgi:quinol monooxygenase YgiN
MLIVAGTLTVDPAQRDEFLAQRLMSTVEARNEPGCLDHILTLDPLDPARLLVYERWETAEDLERHLATARSRARDSAANQPTVRTLSADLIRYEVSGVGVL